MSYDAVSAPVDGLNIRSGFTPWDNGPVVKRGWRAAVTAMGLLFLVGCVVLVGLLVVADSQYAVPVTQFLGIVLGVLALGIPLVARLRRETAVTALTAGQLDEARETLAGVIAQQ